MPESDARVAWLDFDTFYREEYPGAVRLAHLLSGSTVLCEDVAQDALLSMQRHWGSIKHPKAYLRRAVTNGVADQFRSAARREAREVRADLSPVSVDPEYDHLLSALDGLPYQMKATLVLRYYLGCSEREIAEVLQVRPGTVKSFASRGLALLRQEIGS